SSANDGTFKATSQREATSRESSKYAARVPRLAAEECAIDLQVLHHALHIVAGFHEWDSLDPIDGIDLRIARIAEPLDPLPHAPAPGIVGRERQDVVASISDDRRLAGS